MRESWLKGNATGGHPPFGYIIKDKKYVIDDAEAEIVREIFMKYAQGYKAVAIAEDLKARNIRRKCGKHINHKYVYVILHDKRYIGEVTHQGTAYYNIFPPIISKEVWNQVDAINRENKISPSRKKEIFDYILSGKLICGNCKHRMSGESGTSRNGEIHYYYVCLSKRRGKTNCDCKAVKKQELEDYVIDATVSMLQRNSIITKIAEAIVKVHEKMMRDNSGLQILIKKREEAKRAVDNILKAIEQGIIMDFTKDRLAALQDELNRLDIEINKEAQKTYAHVTVEDVEKYLLSKVFEDPDDIKTRKLLVNTFIRDILWYGDHIVSTYNFQEYAATDRFCKSYVEQLEKQVGDASRSASSFSLCSYKFRHSAPTSKNASLRRSVGVFLMSAPCLHERGHKKKDQTAPSVQGVFASAERGRTHRVLHRTNVPSRVLSLLQGNSRRCPHFCADFLHPFPRAEEPVPRARGRWVTPSPTAECPRTPHPRPPSRRTTLSHSARE